MAFVDNDISIETRFQLNNTPKNFKISDNSNYVSGYGIALSDVDGALKITSPTGVVIHNTVAPAKDIDLDVQPYIDTISLPLDSLSKVLEGTYIIEYTIVIKGAVDPGTYTKTFTYDYSNPSISVDLDISVNLIDSTLTSTDNTSYPIGTVQSRTHEIHPPAGLNPVTYPVKTSSTQVLTYNPITTKTWTSKLTNIIEITTIASGSFDSYIIDQTLSGDVEKEIIDDINLCSLQCNMRALVSRYNDALENNPINAVAIANDQLTPALINAFMYTSNISCGNFGLAEAYYQSVLTFTGSQPDCQCSNSDVPTLIQASGVSGSGNDYVVDVCGTNGAMTVTSNTVGSTTTYTICFDDVIWNKINALTETTLTSTGSTVTITSSTSGYVKTWNLEVTTPADTIVHSFIGLMDIDLSNMSVVPLLSWRTNWSTTIGNKLKEPVIINVNGIFADWSSLDNEFYLKDYIDQAGGEYPKPQLQVVYNGSDINYIGIEITQIDTNNDRIYFRFINGNNQPYTGKALMAISRLISVSVLINA